MLPIFVEIIGWLGAFLVLSAYVLLSINKISSNSSMFQILNLLGAIFLIINTYFLEAYPSMFVNVVWVGIAILGMYKNK